MSDITGVDEELTKLGGLLSSVLSELTRYQENHRLLLVVSCSFAELMVGTLIEEYCKNGKEINDNSRDFPFSVRITLLYELGLISDSEYQHLNWLRKRRNEAAHKPGFRFRKEHLPPWPDEYHDSPEKLYSLCINIIGVFWNNRVELFRERLPLEG